MLNLSNTPGHRWENQLKHDFSTTDSAETQERRKNCSSSSRWRLKNEHYSSSLQWRLLPVQTQHRGVIARQKKKFLVKEKFICRSNLRLGWNHEEIASSLWDESKEWKLFKLLAMTIIAWANSTLQRHCEASEKSSGERKIHLPKQSRALLE